LSLRIASRNACIRGSMSKSPMTLACRVRKAAPHRPHPSGRVSSIEVLMRRALSAVGPAVAAISRWWLSALTRKMLLELNRPPLDAAAHTNSNISSRDLARMIASLVALNAANIRDSRSFCWSALAFSLACSKLSGATETFSAIRANSATISSSAAQFLPTKNINTPMLLPNLVSGSATQAMTPVSRPTRCHGPLDFGISLLMQGRWVRNASPHTPPP